MSRKFGVKLRVTHPSRIVGDTHIAMFRDKSDLLLEEAIRRAEERENIKAQHGPVKIIMKDGKLL